MPGLIREKKIRLSKCSWLALLAALMMPAVLVADEHEAEGLSFDGLVQVEDSAAQIAYIDPDADFSVFKRVAILEPYVAFRSNWMRDHNQTRSTNRVRASDMERIKKDVAGLLLEVFTEQLEAAGYDVVNYSGEDVIIVRPAIIDLEVNAPETRTTTSVRTYTSDAGAATIYVELFDSMTGDILGRAADRRRARTAGNMTILSNRVTNRADARRMFRAWADMLVAFLDKHYVKPGSAE